MKTRLSFMVNERVQRMLQNYNVYMTSGNVTNTTGLHVVWLTKCNTFWPAWWTNMTFLHLLVLPPDPCRVFQLPQAQLYLVHPELKTLQRNMAPHKTQPPYQIYQSFKLFWLVNFSLFWHVVSVFYLTYTAIWIFSLFESSFRDSVAFTLIHENPWIWNM